MVYGAPMQELIKRPQTVVTRRLVEGSVLRLVRYPGTTSIRNVMRVIDEYVASLHTDRVYRHADKVVGEALIQAAYAKELDKKIFVRVDGVENFSSEYIENFFENVALKNFLNDLLSDADRVAILVAGPGDGSGTDSSDTNDLGTKGGTNRVLTDDVSTSARAGVDVSTVRVPMECDTSRADGVPTDSAQLIRTLTDWVRTVDASTLQTFSLELAALAATTLSALKPAHAETSVGPTVSKIKKAKGKKRGADKITHTETQGEVSADTDSDGAETSVGSDVPVILNGGVSSEGPAERALSSTLTEVSEESETVGADTGQAAGSETEHTQGEDVKACSRCERVLALSCYGLNRSRPDGRASSCQECELKRNRDRRNTARERRETDAKRV